MNLNNAKINIYFHFFIMCFFVSPVYALDLCAPGQLLEYSSSPEEIIIEYHVEHTILANQDPIPYMRVYGNGLVKVHYPIYMTKAGDYEYQLTQLEVQELLSSLDSNCIFSFNEKKVKEKVKQVKAQQEIISGQRILSYRSDPSITQIKVNLKNYTSSTGEVLVQETLTRAKNLQSIKASWANIEVSAPKYTSISELQGFANAANLLKDISKSNKLKKVQ